MDRRRRLASRGAHVRIARTMSRRSLDEIWTGVHEEGKEPWIQEVGRTAPNANPLASDARWRTSDEVPRMGRKDMVPLKCWRQRSQLARYDEARQIGGCDEAAW